MIEKLIEGAKAAREASVDSCDIEIVVTELGLVIRGKRVVGFRTFAESRDMTWKELDQGVPNLMSNAVALVSIGLRS